MQSVRDDRLTGLVVHELRAPVAIMRAYAQLLEAQIAERPAAAAISHEIATHILEQADLMTDWLDAMLDVRQVQLRDQSPVDLVRLAWTVAQQLQQTTCLHRIEVLASRPVPPPIVGDRIRLRQVLTNLLENAFKHTAGGSIQVRVGLQHTSQRAIVSVHDTGPGIAGPDLRAIFAPFKQSQRREDGLGLGLYLARQIARLHGGDLWAESRGITGGATFVLALPVVPASARVPTHQVVRGDGQRN